MDGTNSGVLYIAPDPVYKTGNRYGTCCLNSFRLTGSGELTEKISGFA